MKKKFTFLMAACIMLLTMIFQPVMVRGQAKTTETYTFNSKDWTATNSSSATADWTNYTAGDSFESTAPARGIAKSKASINGTSPVVLSNVSSITVVASANQAGPTLTIYKVVNNVETSIFSASMTKENNKSYTVNLTGANVFSGKIKVVLASSSSYKSVWIKSVSVTYTPTHTLTYSATNGSIAGTLYGTSTVVNTGDAVAEGGQVSLEATPSAGYSFSSWNVDGTGSTLSSTSANPTIFTMGTVNATVTANFVVTAPTYTITAQSNNETYGTVSLTGSIITATLKSGGRYASPAYTVSSGSATVAQDGNTFTVTPSSNCTITINFEAIPTHTVTFSVNGVTTTQDFAEGASITFPANPSDNNGKTFVGWTDATISGTTDEEPDFVTSATMGGSNVTFYAVFADITTTYSETETEISQTHQYDTWIYSGTTKDMTTYRLFAEDAYIETATFDLSILKEVDVYAGTYGTLDADEKKVTVMANTTTWGTASLSTNSATTKNVITSAVSLSGNGQLHIVAGGGNGSNTGIRISKVDIITKKAITTINNYCTTIVVDVLEPSFSHASGNYYSGQTVTLACATEGATIRYTTDGSDPTSSSDIYSSAFTINHTTTIKAQAFKGAYSSSIAEATYTIKYRVNYYVINTDDAYSTADVVEGEAIETMPEPEAPNGYCFMGWAKSPIDGVQDSAPTMVTVDTIVKRDLNLYAVFAIGTTNQGILDESLDIVPSDFTTSSYNDNNGDHVKDHITYNTNQVYQYSSSLIQFQKSNGYLFNKTELNITSIELTSVAQGSFTIYAGNEENPSESPVSISGGVYPFDGEKYFTIETGSSTAGQVGKITVNYTKPGTVTTYSNYCTSVSAVEDTDLPIDSNNELTKDCEISGVGTLDTHIIIPEGKTLTITGVLGNSDPAFLVVKDGGQLITNNAVQATVKKNVTAYSSATGLGNTDGWYFVALPLNSTSVTPSMLTTGDYDLYQLNPSTAKWENYKTNDGNDNPSFTLANGKAYLYANSAGFTADFAGEVKAAAATGNVTVYNGWNLVGNPFTYNTYLNRPYYKMNEGRTGVEIVEEYDDADNFIAPCTGVVVVTSETSETVTFSQTPPAKSSNNGNLQMVLAQNVATRGEGTAQTLDKAIVSFNEGSQLGKFYFGTQDANLYIPQDNEEYAIVSSNAQGEMPVNFKAHRDGQYTLTVNPEEVEMGYLHLIDNIAGKEVDLLANPSYTFNAKADDYESRFRLVFSANMVNADLDDDFAFFSNGQLVIANEGESILQVIDVNGRIVMTESVNGTCSKAINVKAGVYVLRLIQGTDVKTQKIIVK